VIRRIVQREREAKGDRSGWVLREIHGAATAGCCARVVVKMRSPFEVCRRVW